MKIPALPIRSYGTALAQVIQDLIQTIGLPVRKLEHRFMERKQSESSLICMELDYRNNLIVTGGYDHVLKSYDLQSGRCVKRYVGHGGWVSSMYLHPEKVLLASGSHDKTAKIWDVQSGNCLKTFPHENIVYSVIIDKMCRTIFTGCQDGCAYLWDIETGRCVQTFKRHREAIRCLLLTTDEKLLVSSSDDNTIRVWDVKSGKCLETLSGHTGVVYSIAFSCDEKYLASGSLDDTARLWDLNTGKCLKTFSGHTEQVRPVFLCNNSSQLLTGSFDRTAKLWDVHTGMCLVTYEGGHTDWLRCVRMTADNNHVITGSKDGTICFWDTQTGELLVKLHNIDEGFLWSLPSKDKTSTDWFWTDREDLVKVYSRKDNGDKSSLLEKDDPERAEYLASHNNRARIMQKIQPSTQSSAADTELIEKYQTLDRFEHDIRQLMPPDASGQLEQ